MGGSTETQVLIVGAGPVGLTMANELTRLNVQCRIVDRAPEPDGHSRALVLHCRTQQLLEQAGFRDRIAGQAIPIHGMRFNRGGRHLANIPFDLGPYPALSIPQQRTEELLRAALGEQGVRVQWGTELTGINQRGSSVEAMIGGRTLTAEYVIGCDGAHSTVRHLIQVPFEGGSLPETLWMADSVLDWDYAPDHVWQFLHSDGALSAIPMPGGLWRLVTQRTDGDGEPSQGFFEAAVARCVGAAPRRLEISWMSAFRVNCRLAARYGENRVVLAGDAAHIHSPIGGQGMNIGMQDAFSLALKLSGAQRGAPREVLSSYESERRPVAASVIRSNALITRLAMSKRAVPRLLRDQVVPALLRLAPLARRAGLQASGLR